MAGREIIPPGRRDPAAARADRREAKRQDELWQGYAARGTENAGQEIFVRTSCRSSDPLWIGGAILAAVVAVAGFATPKPITYNDLPPSSVMALAGFVTFMALALLFVFLDEHFPKLMRRFALESVEIRPDGITINAGTPDEGYFSSGEILQVGIEDIKGEPTEYRKGLAGIIGVKHLVLLRGLDEPTAQRLARDFELARRTLWQQRD